MKRNWELIDSIVKTIAESDKDIFGINDFKSAETSEKEIKYTLKLMLDRGLVFDETTRYGVVQVMKSACATIPPLIWKVSQPLTWMKEWLSTA